MNKAKYPLVQVAALVNQNKVDFISRSRSIEQVILVFPKMDATNAEKYILDGLLTLNDSDFSSSAFMWDMVVDIYGKQIDGFDWYIKFSIEQDESGLDRLSEISFHPIEDDLKLANGKTLFKG